MTTYCFSSLYIVYRITCYKDSNKTWFLTAIRRLIWFMVFRYLISFVVARSGILAGHKWYISGHSRWKQVLGEYFMFFSITHIRNQFPFIIITCSIPLRWHWFIFAPCKCFNLKRVFKYMLQKCLKWPQKVYLP